LSILFSDQVLQLSLTIVGLCISVCWGLFFIRNLIRKRRLRQQQQQDLLGEIDSSGFEENRSSSLYPNLDEFKEPSGKIYLCKEKLMIINENYLK
jgi:hypothetical protein